MRRGKLVILLGLVFVLVTLTQISFAAQKNPEEIEIKEFKDKKGPVHFKHKVHNTDRKIECVECHHKAKKGEEITQGCSACHKAKKDGDKVEIKEAFHKNCKDECHKNKTNGKGPTKCDGCHAK